VELTISIFAAGMACATISLIFSIASIRPS
jgi:hypothetical protein